MLSSYLAPSAPPSISAFELTWGYLPSAAPIVNKDCLLCNPFPEWTEVRAAVLADSCGKPLSSSPFFPLFGKEEFS